MAVYKIFADSDATLYSKYPAQNTGLDEILEVGVKNSDNPTNYFVDPVPTEPLLTDDLRRPLIKFSDHDLDTIRSFTSGSWKAYLRLYLANAENLNTTYDLEIRQVSQSWTMGTGKLNDSPETRNGACWYNTSSFVSTTSNWGNGSYYLTSGGGSWNANYTTQSFDYKSDKDINSDVTAMVDLWFSGSVANNGFLIKHTHEIEDNPNTYINLSFFSLDTHTIYPPTLEMRWDDSSYITGSLSVINNSNTIVTLANNMSTFKTGTAKYKMLINARDKYPVRVFTTSSLYTTNKALPQASYWAIQDSKTEDMVIDFDTEYTKISCDGTNSYFNLYMNGLEPERYYKVLIKTVLSDGESIEIDNNLIFKVTR
jgi:hypothetical protein